MKEWFLKHTRDYRKDFLSYVHNKASGYKWVLSSEVVIWAHIFVSYSHTIVSEVIKPYSRLETDGV